ncbi:MAG TPA: ATP-dependent DNA helicase RecG [Acidimicrobiia bacterium]|nr:ATP-dependent DNA helicase RecG [Acidimicrobiia bacterium]HZQ76548.1 ATP-dependent DNA helicase RecG [Acidimicrobiia bacterium]
MGKTLRDLRDVPISRISGVTPRLEERLGMLGIHNVLELIEHYPRRYLDRTKKSDIADLRVGEEATVYAEVRKLSSRRTRQGRALVETIVYDGTSYLYVTFFNQPWRAQQLSVGTEAAFFGKLEHYRGKHQMTNPVVDVLGRIGEKTGVIVPIYPQSGKADVSTWQLQKFVAEALRRARDFDDPVPDEVIGRLGLVDRTRAYNGIHQPETEADHYRAARRLIFDEFLRMQLGLVARKRAFEERRIGLTHRVDGPLVPAFHANLPFPLTGDQQRAIAEIAEDLAAPRPMHRLLQGDVGSGKTVVALTALLTAVQGGYQGALMAPTEVLAEQHHLSISRFLEGLTVASEGTLMGERPVRVELLTNRTGAAGRRRLSAALAAGEVDIVVGTHALIYDTVAFPALGVAVIDEQHRFGVEQRALLRAKGPGGGGPDGGEGPEPDVLVMTATPIPRTAAMLIYGDLDKSELREMPPGRTPITTDVIGPSPLERAGAYQRLRDQVAAGRQAYVVCPLVEGSEKVEAKAATEEAARLEAEELQDLRVGLLHGQMPQADKESTMARFRAGGIDVLVSTTVIEVGVDVPNATVMIIEDADRFGLSQLHQLRGRVGRGGGESWCFLFADPQTAEAEARLEAMAESTDGFLLAERDLEIRGAGEVFGERQAGFTDLKLGRIPRDEPVVLEARRVAEEILDADSGLAAHRRLAEEVEDLLGDDVEFLFKS